MTVAAPAPSGGADPWVARSAGIAGIESGGAKDPYSLMGARTRTGDRAIGKYQIMGANVPQWTQAALGRPMTAEQFRADPDAQEAVFKHRFGQYVDKYGESGAAKAWYAGEGGMKNPNATDVHGRLTVAGYGDDYLKRLAAAGGNPDAAAAAPQVAAAVPTSANAPITPGDIAQEERVADVVGMNRGPTNASYSYPPTASRTGDVISDAPQPGVTGAPNGPMRDAIADTIQQRQQALQPPQPATPPPPGAQLAQASVFPPVQSAGGQVAPIIPGGGLPQQIQSMPQPPAQGIRPMPNAAAQVPEYEPGNNPEPVPPRKSGPGPVEQRLLPILSSDVDERVKKAAELRIAQERAVSAVVDDNAQKVYELKKSAWLKKDEQDRKFLQDRQTTQASIGKTLVETDEGMSKAAVAKANADFLVGKGREREPFLKEFSTDKEVASKVAGQLRQTKIMDEAIRNGSLAGMGADFKLNLNRVGAAIGSKDAAKVAAATEQYQSAAKSLIGYGIMLVNGRDPRVTEGDLKQAQGITGDINLQQASQKKILDVMREDMYGKINDYEDKREFYLRGDPQHRMFKVDVPETAPKDLTEILLKHRDDPNALAIYDRDHGKGAAAFEIKRALRRENRAKKIMQEDD